MNKACKMTAIAVLTAATFSAYAANHTTGVSAPDGGYSETDEIITMNISSGDGYTATDNRNLTLGSENTKKIEIISSATAEKSAGIFLKNKNPNRTNNIPWDDVGYVGVRDTIQAESITIVTNAPGDGGLWIQGQRDFSEYAADAPITEAARAKVQVTAKTLTISSQASAINAFSWSEVQIDADVVKLSARNVICARGGSNVFINANTVQLDGNINFSYHQQTSNTPVDANIVINLDGPDSYWKGNSVITWAGNPTDEQLIVSQAPKIGLSNGASWTPTAVGLTETSNAHLVETLTLNNGIVNINNGVETGAKTVKGSGTINVAVESEGGAFATGSFRALNGGEASLSVNLTGVTTDELSDPETAKAILSSAVIGVEDTTGHVAEGMYNGAMTIRGDNVSQSVNTVMRDSLDMATASTLSLNRILMNDIRKRLGDIRSSEGTSGAWARYDGGRLSGEGLENKFNTIQVGVDTVPSPDSIRFGLAASYTMGDVDYARGNADMDAFSLSAYGIWLGDNGAFADVIARMATSKTDMTVDGDKKGNLDNMALSLSGEFGWRFDVANNFYLEPQIEGTYTYIDSDTTTLNGPSASYTYDFDSVNSLIGRAGLVAGLKCPNNMGDVYIRASAVHEFLGDAKVTGGNGTSHKIDGKDTWVEYAIGANFNINDQTYVWADVERTSGATLDEDWRATVGIRYSF